MILLDRTHQPAPRDFDVIQDILMDDVQEALKAVKHQIRCRTDVLAYFVMRETEGWSIAPAMRLGVEYAPTVDYKYSTKLERLYRSIDPAMPICIVNVTGDTFRVRVGERSDFDSEILKGE